MIKLDGTVNYVKIIDEQKLSRSASGYCISVKDVYKDDEAYDNTSFDYSESYANATAIHIISLVSISALLAQEGYNDYDIVKKSN